MKKVNELPVLICPKCGNHPMYNLNFGVGYNCACDKCDFLIRAGDRKTPSEPITQQEADLAFKNPVNSTYDYYKETMIHGY